MPQQKKSKPLQKGGWNQPAPNDAHRRKEPVKKIILTVVAVFCLLVTAPLTSQTIKVKAKAKNVSSSCTTCHADLSSVLPKSHDLVKSGTITSCLSCHQPNLSGKPEINAFSTAIHRSHVKADGKTDCTLCHNWVPGKKFGIKGTQANLGKVSKDNMLLLKKSFASWASSSTLDASHNQAKVVCFACHGKAIPEKGDTIENDRCLACHGSMESLIARSEPKDFPDRNPHKSHLGEIACTVCHQGHSESKVYCLSCHGKFKMRIPGGE
jgi:hypothetical protein